MKDYLDALADVKVSPEGDLETDTGATRYSTIQNVDGSYRVFDSSTGFQSEHITTGREGAWRSELSAEEQERMMQLVAPWLEKYGFPLN